MPPRSHVPTPEPADGAVPPADPRESWQMVAPGQMQVVARLDDLVTRVLAPNASPMTLDGTNTYVVAGAGASDAAVIDPGPLDQAHLGHVEEVLRELDVQCRWILVTHAHVDHAEAAPAWSRHFAAPVAAATRAAAGPDGVVLSAGARLSVGATRVEVVPTPGHTGDHLAFRLDNGSIVVGDHVLGRGTSVVAHPEGDLSAYLESLRRLLDLGSHALYPGHGPELVEDPGAVLRYYLEHRQFRERQIMSLLRAAPAGRTPSELVTDIYADLDPSLRVAAAQSTKAALEKLAAQGDVALAPDGVARLVVS